MSWVLKVTAWIVHPVPTSAWCSPGPTPSRCDTPHSVPTGHHCPRLHGQVPVQRPVRLDRSSDQPRPPQQERHGGVCLGESPAPSIRQGWRRPRARGSTSSAGDLPCREPRWLWLVSGKRLDSPRGAVLRAQCTMNAGGPWPTRYRCQGSEAEHPAEHRTLTAKRVTSAGGHPSNDRFLCLPSACPLGSSTSSDSKTSRGTASNSSASIMPTSSFSITSTSTFSNWNR